MAMRDEDFGAALTPVEADDGHWSPPMAAPARGSRDWQSLYEQAHARAEELRRAETAARSRAGSLKWQLDKSRDKLKAAVEEVKGVRRAAKDALFFQAEVARLEKLLSQAGVDSSRRGTIMSLRMEVFRLREALQASQARKDATAPSSGMKVKPLKAAPAPAAGKGTTGPLSRENARLRKALERSQEQKDELVALRRKVAALRRSKRAAQASPLRASARLRKALERTRKQKDTIKALRGEVGSLNRETRRLNRENGRLRRELEPLQGVKKTVRRLSDQAKLLRGELAGYHDRMDLIALLTRRVDYLTIALRKSAIEKEGLEAELADRPLLPAVFRRLRDRDKAIASLRKANERLGEKTKGAAGSERETGSPDCQASYDPGRAVEGALRQQEREAGHAGHGGASAASNAALPGTAAPSGRRSRRRRNGRIRRRTRSCAPVAESPMSPTASVPRPSSRSRSRRTPAGSSGPATAGVATARPRPWK